MSGLFKTATVIGLILEKVNQFIDLVKVFFKRQKDLENQKEYDESDKKAQESKDTSSLEDKLLGKSK